MSNQLIQLGLREIFVCNICREHFHCRSTFSYHCSEVHRIDLLPSKAKETIPSIDDHPHNVENNPHQDEITLEELKESQENDCSIVLVQNSTSDKTEITTRKKAKPKVSKAKKSGAISSKKIKETINQTDELQSEIEPTNPCSLGTTIIDETLSTTPQELCIGASNPEVQDQIAGLELETLTLTVSVPISKLIRKDKILPSIESCPTKRKELDNAYSKKYQLRKRNIPKKDTSLSSMSPEKMQNNENQLVACKTDAEVAAAPQKPVSPNRKTTSPDKIGHICPIPGCAKAFSKRNQHRYINHLQIHEGLKPFVCPHCEFGYDNDIKLIQHVTIQHTKEPIFECQCGQKYKTERFLLAHKKRFGH